MPVYDTPITTDDNNLQKVLKVGLPIMLYLHDRPNPQMDDVLKQIARDNVGKMLVVRLDTATSPQSYGQYGRPTLPALITLDNGSVKSQAGSIQPNGVADHARYLLGQGSKPKEPEAAKQAASGATQSKPFAVTDATFAADVLQSDTPVLVDFWATWCAPCRAIAPSLEQLAQQYAGQVKIAKLDVDKNPRAAQQYQAMSIPMLLMFKNGQVVGRLVGGHPKSNIEQLIRQNL